MTGQVVYLHVGAPKTGTTYVQDLLFRNRERLAEEGSLYAADRFDDYFMAALDLLGLNWGGLGAAAVGAWDRLIERIRDWPGTVVISHEILASASPKQVRRALVGLASAEVHIVYSARDLGRQFPAEWQETVKHQRSTSFATFLEEQVANYEAGGADWFWRVQTWPEVLRRWGGSITPNHVHVVTVPPAGGRHDLLWDRFRTLLGIEPEWCTVPSDRANPSLGTSEIGVLRAVNERVRGKLSNADYRYLVREQLAHLTLARRNAADRATLPPSLDPWVHEVTATWLAQLRQAGYDVCGDLDELQPATPAAASEWMDPDSPDEPRSLEAAIDCIERLLFEAARIDADRLLTQSERDDARRQVAESEQRVRDVTTDLQTHLETPAWQRFKRAVVLLGKEHRSLEALLNGYRWLRRGRAVPADDSVAAGSIIGGTGGSPVDEGQDRLHRHVEDR